MRRLPIASISIAALVLSFCAFLLSVLALAKNGSSPSEVQRVEVSQSASVPESEKVAEEIKKPKVEYSCWEETIYGCSGDWLYHNEYDDQDYLVTLGDPDEDGEIRKLRVRYPDGQVKEVGQLESNLSYVGYWSEFDGSPINQSPVPLSGEGNNAFRIEVYKADVALDLFDYRLPVLVKYITFLINTE